MLGSRRSAEPAVEHGLAQPAALLVVARALHVARRELVALVGDGVDPLARGPVLGGGGIDAAPHRERALAVALLVAAFAELERGGAGGEDERTRHRSGGAKDGAGSGAHSHQAASLPSLRSTAYTCTGSSRPESCRSPSKRRRCEPRTRRWTASDTRISPGLRQLFEARRHIHGVADRGEVRPPIGADVAHHDRAGVDADAHADLVAVWVELAVALLDGPHDVHRRGHRCHGVILHRNGRAEVGHHRVADELVERAAAREDAVADQLEDLVQERHDVAGFEALREAREAADVREQDRHVALGAGEVRALRALEQRGQHVVARVAAEGALDALLLLQGLAHVVEGEGQLAHLVPRGRRDARGEIARGHPLDPRAQAPERADQERHEAEPGHDAEGRDRERHHGELLAGLAHDRAHQPREIELELGLADAHVAPGDRGRHAQPISALLGEDAAPAEMLRQAHRQAHEGGLQRGHHAALAIHELGGHDSALAPRIADERVQGEGIVLEEGDLRVLGEVGRQGDRGARDLGLDRLALVAGRHPGEADARDHQQGHDESAELQLEGSHPTGFSSSEGATKRTLHAARSGSRGSRTLESLSAPGPERLRRSPSP